MGSVKTLIHVHTDYSLDSNLSLEALAWSVANERIGCIAITDHDTIDGALRFRSMTDALVIVGEEITTRDGHLIGLYLHERIPPGMSARATALAIRAQGGLVFVPHPFVRFYGCGLRDRLAEVTDLIDAVEINNAQNILRRPDRQAERYAEHAGCVRYVGADTHRVGTIAPCYQYLRHFDGPHEFLPALAAARLVPGYHSPRYLATMAYTAVRAIGGLGMPSDCGANARIQPTVGDVLPAPDLAATRL
jgi:predicted metal-dependent phosphoesterase TrpH